MLNGINGNVEFCHSGKTPNYQMSVLGNVQTS